MAGVELIMDMQGPKRHSQHARPLCVVRETRSHYVSDSTFTTVAALSLKHGLRLC